MNDKVAVLIPCYNEEITIAKVIKDFRNELKSSGFSSFEIYVYDNNSSDNTAKIAKENGAILSDELRRGKGNVIRSMFRNIEADIYVMIDGDDTYPVEFLSQIISTIKEGRADMVVGNRHANGMYKEQNIRKMHNFGNNLVKSLINNLFNSDLQDVMSGYRAFSKEFVKNIHINSSGFEVETEITLHALDKYYSICEVPISYRNRPEGSLSKLDTFADGLRVLKTILWLFKDYKPLKFFFILSLLFFVTSLLIGIPVIVEFIDTSKIERIPSAILSASLMLISIISIFSGLILETISKNQSEMYGLRRAVWKNKR